jgi:hypothetical protein
MSATMTIPAELRAAMLIAATELVVNAADDDDFKLSVAGGEHPATDENIAHDAKVIELLRAALTTYEAVLHDRPVPIAALRQMVAQEMSELRDFQRGAYFESAWADERESTLNAVREWAIAHGLVDREGAAA